MSSRPEILFVGLYADYRHFLRMRGLQPKHVLYLTSIHQLRGVDLSHTEILIENVEGITPNRDVPEVIGRMRSLGADLSRVHIPTSW